MAGMSASTGQALDGLEHLRQSIRDILTTRVGERVMRRAYGSRLPDLVDAPLNRFTLLAIIRESALAIGRWEPRVKIKRVWVDSIDAGRVTLAMEGDYIPTDGTLSRPVKIEGLRL